MLEFEHMVCWSIATTCTLVVWAGSVAATASSPLTLSVHFVAPCELERASVPMEIRGSRRQYCLERSPIMSQTDVVSAAYDKLAYDKTSLVLTLNDKSARFRDVTRKSIGLEIGVVLNGQLVSVATIQSPEGQMWLNGLPQKEADAVIESFKLGDVAKTDPPPLPIGKSNPADNGDSVATLIRKVKPEYTAKARAAKIEGVVALRVVIRPDGTLGEVDVTGSLDPELDIKAVECVRSWRFRPARRADKPIASTATVEVVFRL